MYPEKEVTMQKILIVIFLIMMCAALEVPEDYQWTPDREYVATLSALEGYDQLCTSMSKEIRLPE
jgi:hypothetical protein